MLVSLRELRMAGMDLRLQQAKTRCLHSQENDQSLGSDTLVNMLYMKRKGGLQGIKLIYQCLWGEALF